MPKNKATKKLKIAEVEGVQFSDDPRDIGWVRKNIPCQNACPADTNIPEYIRAIFEENYGRAYEINRNANVLPGVLGRICSRPCENSCRHGWPGNGEPVSICNLKRVAADQKQDNSRMSENLFASTGKRIAIIGAGPAGITAARDLSILGHDVTLLEREEFTGGMLRYGIPEFRLPRDMLNTELHNALRLGVELKTGVNVGKGKNDVKVSDLLKKYDAVLLSTGCMVASTLPLRDAKEGEDPARNIDNVEYGLDFLLELHRGEKKKVGNRVAVVGAGFTALDCARVARRLGGKEVTIHLRTTEEYIPVSKEEILESKREGVEIKGLRTPVAIITDKNGKLTGIQFVQNLLGGFREGGRRQAIPIEGSEFIEQCDTLIIAIGQKTINDYIDVKIETEGWGTIKINQDGMTSTKGLFAAGDFVLGATTAIEAVGHGHKIARNIDSWLMGRARRKKTVRIEPVSAPQRERSYDFIARQHMSTISIEERFKSLDKEVETGFDCKSSCEESKRCYLCNLKYEIDVSRCIYCRACIDVAPRNCIKLIKGIEINKDGSYGNLEEATEWNKVGAIWIDNNECIRCGACYKACPVKCISISKLNLVEVDV